MTDIKIRATFAKNDGSTRVMNMYRDAYDDMIDKKHCPRFSRAFVWSKMNKKERIKAHLNDIAEYLQEKLIDWHIFED